MNREDTRVGRSPPAAGRAGQASPEAASRLRHSVTIPNAEEETELASRLNFRLQADGLSLRAAAPQIGVSFSTLGRIARGGGMIPRNRRKLERWLSGGPSARAIRGDFDEYDWQLLQWLRAVKPERGHTSGSDFSQGVIRGFEVVIAQIENRHHRKYIQLPDEAGVRPIAAELHEALELADCLLSGANMNRRLVERKVRGALAKASGIVAAEGGRDAQRLDRRRERGPRRGRRPMKPATPTPQDRAIPHPIGEAFVMLALLPGLVVGMLLVMP